MISEALISHASEIYNLIKDNLLKEDISEIKTTHGRKQTAPRACKSGASIYTLYSRNNEVLYVGETGKSIKTRCFGDGSGSHSKKEWFHLVSYVLHYTENSSETFGEKERKLIEQAVSITLKPVHYGS